MMEGSHADNNRGPIKEIALAVALLVFGTLAIFLGIFMAINKVGGDTAHGKSPKPLLFYFYFGVQVYSSDFDFSIIFCLGFLLNQCP